MRISDWSSDVCSSDLGKTFSQGRERCQSRRAMTTPLTLADIQIRDPFVLTVPEEGTYYLFGSTDADIWHPPATGFDCYRSTDLERWEGPIEAFRPPAGFWSDRNFWAPEVHRYAGRFFLFATLDRTRTRLNSSH